MQIKLRFPDGKDKQGNLKFKEKTFAAPFVSGRMFRKALEISKKLEHGFSDPKDLDAIVDFVVELYGKQFTRDEFYDGIRAQKLVETVMDAMNELMGEANDALGIDEEEAKNVETEG